MAGKRRDKQDEQAARKARLAAALKDNLRRRKAQARDRRDLSSDDGTTDDGAGGEPRKPR